MPFLIIFWLFVFFLLSADFFSLATMLMDCHLDDVSLECIVTIVVFDVFDSHSPTLYWNELLVTVLLCKEYQFVL